ncbi:MAG TPA: XdhC family protein [Steroidobacteraceae bacterium]|nr:XdhC family protein [Steroidobacteraceae bacterium]
MIHPLDAPLAPLVRDFLELRSRGEPCVLATVVATAGSTYRKSGAQMLVTAQAELRGLLSGGCLEVDLVERSRRVLESGRAELASYDMRGEDDLLFGIGSGCEGAMEVLLQRVGPAEDWQPLARAADCLRVRREESLAVIVTGPAAGRVWWTGGGDAPWPEPPEVAAARATGETRSLECRAGGDLLRALVLPLRLPPGLLICGAGVDAVPLARLAVALGFAVTVCDHRPALAAAQRFPHCEVRCAAPPEAASQLELARFRAAVVMSHHLPSDQVWLSLLAQNPRVGYVGLLGPPARRARLLDALGPAAESLRQRLHAPVGLDIGARTPEAIALAIAAELHAWIADQRMGTDTN